MGEMGKMRRKYENPVFQHQSVLNVYYMGPYTIAQLDKVIVGPYKKNSAHFS